MKKRDVVVAGGASNTLPQMIFIMTALAMTQWNVLANI